MDRERLIAHKLANALQSLLLIGALALLLGLLAWIIGGGPFVLLALALVALLYLVNPVASPRLVTMLYPGRVLHWREAPDHYAILRELAARARLPVVPQLYYIPSPTLQAFATGRPEQSLVAVSDGLVRGLSLREQSGVLAHEISHIANGDLAVMAFADLLSRIAGVLSLVGQWLLLLSLPALLLETMEPPWLTLLILLAAPTLSALVQLALSRNREFEADRRAAELTGDPRALASALEKLERWQGRFWEQVLMPGRRLPEPSLLRTHPETSERVRRLLAFLPQSKPPQPVLESWIDPGHRFADVLADGRRRRVPRQRIGGLWY